MAADWLLWGGLLAAWFLGSRTPQLPTPQVTDTTPPGSGVLPGGTTLPPVEAQPGAGAMPPIGGGIIPPPPDLSGMPEGWQPGDPYEVPATVPVLTGTILPATPPGPTDILSTGPLPVTPANLAALEVWLLHPTVGEGGWLAVVSERQVAVIHLNAAMLSAASERVPIPQTGAQYVRLVGDFATDLIAFVGAETLSNAGLLVVTAAAAGMGGSLLSVGRAAGSLVGGLISSYTSPVATLDAVMPAAFLDTWELPGEWTAGMALDAADAALLAPTEVGSWFSLSGVTDLFGQAYAVLGPLQGPIGLGLGIIGDNPNQMVGNISPTLESVAKLLNVLGGAANAELAAGAIALAEGLELSGSLSLSALGADIALAPTVLAPDMFTLAEVGLIGADAAPALAIEGVSTLAVETATSLAAEAAAMISSIASALAIPLMVAGFIISNNLKKAAKQKAAQIRESAEIRAAFAYSWPRFVKAIETYALAMTIGPLIGALSPAQAARALTILRDELIVSYSNEFNVGYFFGTYGGANVNAGIQPIDTTPFHHLAALAEGSIRWGLIRVWDAAARLGLDAQWRESHNPPQLSEFNILTPQGAGSVGVSWYASRPTWWGDPFPSTMLRPAVAPAFFGPNPTPQTEEEGTFDFSVSLIEEPRFVPRVIFDGKAGWLRTLESVMPTYAIEWGSLYGDFDRDGYEEWQAGWVYRATGRGAWDRFFPGLLEDTAHSVVKLVGENAVPGIIRLNGAAIPVPVSAEAQATNLRASRERQIAWWASRVPSPVDAGGLPGFAMHDSGQQYYQINAAD